MAMRHDVSLTTQQSAASSVRSHGKQGVVCMPDFTNRKLPLGDVFVHGSGECDQLGLGDAMRERKKPTLLKSLIGKNICEVAVGTMHVLCVSTGGALYSWGCNDDAALGRAPSDGSDGGPSDVEPHPVRMPSGVAVRHVSCGDCHSCALDEKRRVWLWGTYKDSNGYIGIAHKRKQETEVLEKSAEPTLVLEGCLQIASGANHTVALAAPSGHNQVFAWGSNATGQLGLQDACGFSERTLPCSGSNAGLAPREGGGCEVAGEQVVRIHQADGSVRAATSMTAEQIQQAVVQGATALVLQVAEREVPKPEKQKLLRPQHVPLEAGAGEHVASGVHTSAEGSFVTFVDGAVFGCGLNGHGQLGLGFVSMAVKQFQAVPAVRWASWIGGGLDSAAALVDGRVFTWGKAEECGIGLGEKDPPVLQPREVQGLPRVRVLRCGVHHMLASTEGGDLFVWGCGLTHQLANRPRDVSNPTDADEEPTDELRPYQVSSKQLQKRFVIVADGGAQHSVELAWGGEYSTLSQDRVVTGLSDALAGHLRSGGGGSAHPSNIWPIKRLDCNWPRTD
ncbi:Regulator of chromosome condensation [Symbiodinium microadriaticum]|uniref:Regulator of chromosome condensation n=1 Tax=Symbiodinium microadriaticum TaxID=2951 RepID=A0A1Q9CF56_SYMMI|nr:Regulator of chromosome condensation [Symbiodinium microadriaticum]